MIDPAAPDSADVSAPDGAVPDARTGRTLDELRVVIECADWDLAVDFYHRALGLPAAAGYASRDQGQLLLEVGSAFIELIHPELPGPEAEGAGPTEIAAPASPRLRLSFRSHDPAATVSRMEAAGAERITEPDTTTAHAVTARLVAPDRLPISVFASDDDPGFSEPSATSLRQDIPEDSGTGTGTDTDAEGDPEVAPSEAGSGIHSLIYSSRVTTDLTDQDLIELLATSRQNNDELGLTGVLLYRQGRFLQYLEGPRQALLDRVGIIAADDRHTSFVTLLQEDIPRRLFPAWSMGFERLSTRAAADIPGYRSSFADLSAPDEPGGALGALNELSRWFAARSGAAQL